MSRLEIILAATLLSVVVALFDALSTCAFWLRGGEPPFGRAIFDDTDSKRSRHLDRFRTPRVH